MHRVAHGLLHGSSPRAWGTPWRRPGPAGNARFIPTGVGNTRSGSQARRQDPVHPHGRGEHIDMPVPRPSAYGSSPRAWGTLRVECSASQQPRFIPTGVGNTGSPSPRNPKTPVHPHGRGEHAVGKAEAAAAHRFIPTGVGNTRAGCACPRPPAVHPHGRGEHAGRAAGCGARCGSSPRAWGTRAVGRPARYKGRFIPTGVGNTRLMRWSAMPRPVHPHGRGEHITSGLMVWMNVGSSPRAWGTLVRQALDRGAVRFIPTGVGNTAPPPSPATTSAVHPHGRGEHGLATGLPADLIGSSPRAWGTRRPGQTRGVPFRFIPTGVGNT